MEKSRRIRSADEKISQNSGGTILSGGYRCVREEDVEVDLKFVGWKGTDRIEMTQDTDIWRGVVHTTMKLQTSLRSELE